MFVRSIRLTARQSCSGSAGAAHRLALTLEAEGFLSRGRKGYYHAGPVLVAAIAGATEVAQTAARLRQPLARLARQQTAFTHFGVLEDAIVTYLVKEKGLEAELFTEERMQLGPIARR